MYTLRQRYDLGPLSQSATTDGLFASEGSEEQPSGQPMLEVSELPNHSSAEAEERTTTVARSCFCRHWTEQEDDVLGVVMQETLSMPERHRMFNETSTEAPRTLPAIRKRCDLLKNGTPLTNSLRLNMYSERHISYLQELLLSQSDWDNVVNCFNQRFNVGLTKSKLRDVVERRKFDTGFRKVVWLKWREAHDDFLRRFAQTISSIHAELIRVKRKGKDPRLKKARSCQVYAAEEVDSLQQLAANDQVMCAHAIAQFSEKFGDKRTYS